MSMHLLFFDTETTGLIPKNLNIEKDLNLAPFLLSISWQVYSNDKCILSKTFFRKPDTFSIDNSSIATKIHGITSEIANEKGKPILDILLEFRKDLYGIDKMIAHNLNFDESIVSIEAKRLGITVFPKNISRVCTVLLTETLFGKYMKLESLCKYFFNHRSYNFHSSEDDVRACADVYFYVMENF